MWADPRRSPAGRAGVRLPGGKQFAFTILDDTDDATLENVAPVYELLHALGMRTTKTAWPLDCPEGSRLYFAAQTLQDPEYLAFVRDLLARGFELASHGATMETSDRARTLRGLEFVESQLGSRPSVHCNHGQNLENLYWGAERYRTRALRWPLLLLERAAGRPRYSGHIPSSPLFWGDLCRARFRFVRGFTFATLNTLALPPHGPYRLRSTPWVNYWFNTSDAPDARHFKQLVTPPGVKGLMEEGGICILSTHLGKGFARGGRVDPQVEETLSYMASLPGWFAPVSEVLEHLLAERPEARLSVAARWRLETRHVLDRLRARRVYRKLPYRQ